MPTPSLLIVPARFKTGKLYSQIPTSGAGDFTVTRNTEARRFDSAGLVASVASGIPRLDYYTSGGVTGCPALLVEPSATNGILNASDLTGVNWTAGPYLARASASVVGLNGANLTVVSGGSGVGSSNGANVRSSNNISLTSGITYTISFFVKITGTHTKAGYYVPITGAAAGDLGGGFDVSGSFTSGSIYNTANVTNRIRRVEAWGGDVFRCSETFTMGANGLLTNIFLAPINAVNNAANSAVGTQLAFAGPQVEQGSFPTSFIPTTAGTGSRSADVISVTGAVSGSIGQSEGTIYAEVDLRNLGYNGAVITVQTDNWITNSIQIQKSLGNQWRFTIRAASTVIVNVDVGTITAGIYKVALAYNTATSGTVLAVNGSILSTQTASSIPACNSVVLGARNETGTFTVHLNDRLRAVALYTTRLTNAELQALTA